jgi:hypothetical protein
MTNGLNALVDATTMNSGLILTLYLAGNIFNIAGLKSIDDYALYGALFFATAVTVLYSINNIRTKTDPPRDVTENTPRFEPKFSAAKVNQKRLTRGRRK